jgi:hypothetical protein
MKRTVCILLLVALLIPIVNLLSAQEEDVMDEAEIKSGLIYNICKFARWNRPIEPGAPFVISIIGKTTPANEIYVPKEKQILGRRVIVRKISSVNEIDKSFVLFITGSESNRLDEILSYVNGKNILTIGDTSGFAKRGVCINFYEDKGSVRFEINRAAVQKTSIELHAHIYVIGTVINE